MKNVQVQAARAVERQFPALRFKVAREGADTLITVMSQRLTGPRAEPVRVTDAMSPDSIRLELQTAARSLS